VLSSLLDLELELGWGQVFQRRVPLDRTDWATVLLILEAGTFASKGRCAAQRLLLQSFLSRVLKMLLRKPTGSSLPDLLVRKFTLEKFF